MPDLVKDPDTPLIVNLLSLETVHLSEKVIVLGKPGRDGHGGECNPLLGWWSKLSERFAEKLVPQVLEAC